MRYTRHVWFVLLALLVAVGLGDIPASAQKRPNIVMLMDPTSAPVELSGREIESVIDPGTTIIADAANAITLKDYSAFTAGPTV